MTFTACLDCGEPCTGPRCPDHEQLGPRRRGYDRTWQLLSERARRLQPFCSDCGTGEDLTCDHSPEAWARRARGQVIRLKDIQVFCRGCNTRRGRSRPGGSPCDGRRRELRRSKFQLLKGW